MNDPSIELHVHLEGAASTEVVQHLAARNGLADPPAALLARPAREVDAFNLQYAAAVGVMRTRQDFADVVVDYASRAAQQGIVYAEAIFTPSSSLRMGASLDTIFGGYCDGAKRASSEFSIELRLTPDVNRRLSVDEAELIVDHAIAHASRGVVGIGLGGDERHGPRSFAVPLARARSAGLAVLPHAGEMTGAPAVWETLDALSPARLRHGFRAAEDPRLVEHLAATGVGLDLCPTSNFRLGFSSVAEYPLGMLLDAGVRCSVSTDDPAIFACNLSDELDLVTSTWRIGRRALFNNALAGAICDPGTKAALQTLAGQSRWST